MKVTRLKELVVYIVSKAGPVSQLKLAKLIYLIEWGFYSEHGIQLTKAYYLRERRGPVPASFGSELEELVGFELEMKRGVVIPGSRSRFDPQFTASEQSFIDATLKRYQRRSERDLLLATYLSEPMKTVLREERSGAVRTHEGISFQRFPSKAHSKRARAVSEPADFEFIPADQMSDDDTTAIMESFAQGVPLMSTAQGIPQEPEA